MILAAPPLCMHMSNSALRAGPLHGQKSKPLLAWLRGRAHSDVSPTSLCTYLLASVEAGLHRPAPEAA